MKLPCLMLHLPKNSWKKSLQFEGKPQALSYKVTSWLDFQIVLKNSDRCDLLKLVWRILCRLLLLQMFSIRKHYQILKRKHSSPNKWNLTVTLLRSQEDFRKLHLLQRIKVSESFIEISLPKDQISRTFKAQNYRILLKCCNTDDYVQLRPQNTQNY